MHKNRPSPRPASICLSFEAAEVVWSVHTSTVVLTQNTNRHLTVCYSVTVYMLCSFPLHLISQPLQHINLSLQEWILQQHQDFLWEGPRPVTGLIWGMDYNNYTDIKHVCTHGWTAGMSRPWMLFYAQKMTRPQEGFTHLDGRWTLVDFVGPLGEASATLRLGVTDGSQKMIGSAQQPNR